MKDYDREALLERVDREGSFVGVEIPETVELDGDEFALRDYVFEARNGSVESVHEVKKKLRRRRTSLYRSLENDEMTYDEGVELAETVAGIDRALTSLERVGSEDDLDAEAERHEKADTQRWLEFLKKVTGSSGSRSRE